MFSCYPGKVNRITQPSSGGHGIAATDEPHCGSISRTPISCSYMSRYFLKSPKMRAWKPWDFDHEIEIIEEPKENPYFAEAAKED